MTSRRAHLLMLALSLGLLQTSCGRVGPPNDDPATALDAGSNPQTEAIPADRRVSGQTLYLPAYSSVATADGGDLFQLAITVVVRNTDQVRPIVVSRVAYFNQRGKLVKEHLAKPIQVAPRAAAVFFVKESDTQGGMAASFVIEWASEHATADPIVESIMVGTASMQGISMRCQAQVLEDHRRPSRTDGVPSHQ